MENRIIKKKYEYWQEDDNCFILATENINFDSNKVDGTNYLYKEYLNKIIVFEEEYDLMEYLIHELAYHNQNYTYDESKEGMPYLIDNNTCEEHWFVDREGLIKYLAEMLRNIEKDGE